MPLKFNMVCALGLAHLIHRFIKKLNDMKAIKGNLGLWEVLGNPGNIGGLRIPAIVTVCSRFIVTDKLLVAEG